MITLIAVGEELHAPLEVRGSVYAFARLMESALQANDHKGGWDECDPRWLLAKLMEEVGELAEIVVRMYRPNGERFHQSEAQVERALVLCGIQESADVGNVAMMLADMLSREYVVAKGAS